MRNLSLFKNDQRGNVAVIFSLALLPLMAFAGVGVDYGRALLAKAKLQSAVDAAALIAAQDTQGKSDAVLQAIAADVVRADVTGRSGLSVIRVGLQTANGQIAVEAAVSMPMSITRILGYTNMSISARASASKPQGQKTDIYLLLDNSASMGLAATPQGRDKLFSLTGCAFACHEPEGGQVKSNLKVAQENGILTRLDVLRASVTTLLTRIEANKTPLDTIRVAVTSFDEMPKLQTPITTDLSQARNYVQNYQLGGDTLFSKAMPDFQSGIGASGDGRTVAKKFALLVTDGVQGKRDRSIGFKPFDSALCTQLKSQGVTMIVLNTEYVPMPAEAAYRETVMPIQDKLAPALQACASPGFYYSAVDQQDIVRAFDGIFQSLIAKIYLTR